MQKKQEISLDSEFISFYGLCCELISESKAQLFQDVWVLWRSTKYENSEYFVEVGACDPIRLSNTFLLEKKAGFKGILIEPNPKLAQELRGKRTAQICEVAIYNSGLPVELILSAEPEFSRFRSSSKIIHNLFYCIIKISAKAILIHKFYF
jgi:hypothetical protein